jgi:hypothetical protein
LRQQFTRIVPEWKMIFSVGLEKGGMLQNCLSDKIVALQLSHALFYQTAASAFTQPHSFKVLTISRRSYDSISFFSELVILDTPIARTMPTANTLLNKNSQEASCYIIVLILLFCG